MSTTILPIKIDGKIETTLMKPSIFKNIDISQHLRSNILKTNLNCNHLEKDNYYYCLTCKISFCNECKKIIEHKNHIVLNKNNFYDLDEDFFTDIDNNIKISLNLEKNKEEYINILEKNIDLIHKKINEIKNLKIKEINDLFLNTGKNLSKFYENFCNFKELTLNYFQKNKKFFNINFKENNNDKENTIFLMNFEIINLIDNKNLETYNYLNNLKKEFDNYKKSINEQSQLIINNISALCNLFIPNNKPDDLYWEIKQRIKSYNNQIITFQKTLCNVMNKDGNLNSINDLINIIDSKNKKGINFIINQDFFINNSKKYNSKNTVRSNSSKKIFNRNINLNNNSNNCKINSNSIYKSSLTINESNNSNKQSHKNIITNNIIFNNLNNNNVSKTKPNNNSIKYYNKLNKIKRIVCSNSLNSSMNDLKILNYEDIILENENTRRYFSHSIIDLYNRLFTIHSKKNLELNTKVYNDSNIKHFIFHESIKPIINSNNIIIYDNSNLSYSKITIDLNKEKHGYEKFPEGCRHILINKKLYICGGVDSLGNSLNIVLLYDLKTGEIKRISNMILPHSYFSIEYLDNYDCFIILGGKDTKGVEIFDLYTKKFSRLPDLNYCRCDISIYFDQYNNEVYAMFGLLNITNVKNNSEIIEILELKDISSGWIKLDYYKESGCDLKNTHVKVVPFTRNKLLIYGGNKPRFNNKIFAIFMIDKNEMIKVDKRMLEEIKLEEKKIKDINKIINNLDN